MEARINPFTTTVGPKLITAFVSTAKAVSQSPLPAEVQKLVNIRSSQINGCGACLDMHVKDALEAGEDAPRLHLVAA